MTAALTALTLTFICVAAAHHTTGRCQFTPQMEAQEGEDVTLQCCVVPQIDLKARTVEWKRVDLNKIVHLYRHRKDDPDPQMGQYRGRTTLNHEDLSRGILTLLISSVQQSDSGEYRCSVPKQNRTNFIRLNVKKSQLNMTMEGEFSTRPQLENVTNPNNPDAEKKDVGAIVGCVCLVALVLVLIFTVLVKREEIKKCWKGGMPRRETDDHLQMNCLMTSSTRNDQGQNGATVNCCGSGEQAER